MRITKPCDQALIPHKNNTTGSQSAHSSEHCKPIATTWWNCDHNDTVTRYWCCIFYSCPALLPLFVIVNVYNLGGNPWKTITQYSSVPSDCAQWPTRKNFAVLHLEGNMAVLLLSATFAYIFCRIIPWTLNPFVADIRIIRENSVTVDALAPICGDADMAINSPGDYGLEVGWRIMCAMLFVNFNVINTDPRAQIKAAIIANIADSATAQWGSWQTQAKFQCDWSHHNRKSLNLRRLCET